MVPDVATSPEFDPMLTLAGLALRLGVTRQMLHDLRRQGRNRLLAGVTSITRPPRVRTRPTPVAFFQQISTVEF